MHSTVRTRPRTVASLREQPAPIPLSPFSRATPSACAPQAMRRGCMPSRFSKGGACPATTSCCRNPTTSERSRRAFSPRCGSQSGLRRSISFEAFISDPPTFATAPPCPCYVASDALLRTTPCRIRGAPARPNAATAPLSRRRWRRFPQRRCRSIGCPRPPGRSWFTQPTHLNRTSKQDME